ncbi:hypothetical protein L210DRAFT_977792 [Boletus edulis BED1]|uniref:ZZ-type zinc finger-containing protein 3 n=1 Tax=Boletus edulis BED1 TaxID=1328754 RepID=A0AAD4C940_BOLED|nr:hypothetical protein L210DRAFT_977792 [Boletus edulis BED1]
MDSRRAETLEALSAYLQHQKILLARTQADIEKLKKLRADALASPEQFANHSNFQENDASTSRLLRFEDKILELQDYHPAQSFPAKIDWEVFSSSDATPLRTLAIRTRIDHTQRTVPFNTQCSPLSFLQKFVKDARKVILDPVFESLSASADMFMFSNPTVTSNPHVNSSSSNDNNYTPTLTLPSSLSEDEDGEHPLTPVAQESMPAIRKRERARAKIRDLKKRKIKSDLVVGCKLGEEGSNGVFVRHDMEDESAEVDVNTATPQSCLSTLPDQISDPMDIDNTSAVTPEDATQHTKLPSLPRTRHPVPRRDSTNPSPRTRKPSLRLQSQSLTALTELKNEPPLISGLPIPSQSLGKRCRDIAEINDTVRKPKTTPQSMSEVNAETDKSGPGTYKQAWSISEQHLLERLLEEIPDGERNRWAKISQAMGGRRTPRQVASRVQKYFEKLKRFGVGVDNKGKAKS